MTEEIEAKFQNQIQLSIGDAQLGSNPAKSSTPECERVEQKCSNRPKDFIEVCLESKLNSKNELKNMKTGSDQTGSSKTGLGQTCLGESVSDENCETIIVKEFLKSFQNKSSSLEVQSLNPDGYDGKIRTSKPAEISSGHFAENNFSKLETKTNVECEKKNLKNTQNCFQTNSLTQEQESGSDKSEMKTIQSFSDQKLKQELSCQQEKKPLREMKDSNEERTFTKPVLKLDGEDIVAQEDPSRNNEPGPEASGPNVESSIWGHEEENGKIEPGCPGSSGKRSIPLNGDLSAKPETGEAGSVRKDSGDQLTQNGIGGDESVKIVKTTGGRCKQRRLSLLERRRRRRGNSSGNVVQEFEMKVVTRGKRTSLDESSTKSTLGFQNVR